MCWQSSVAGWFVCLHCTYRLGFQPWLVLIGKEADWLFGFDCSKSPARPMVGPQLPSPAGRPVIGPQAFPPGYDAGGSR